MEFNKVTFLKLWVSPVEEQIASVDASQCIPVADLLKMDNKQLSDQLGDAAKMRAMIKVSDDGLL